MPRSIEFDRDEVLDRAMQVFWEQGYEGASISDLLKRMNIKRQSLYYAFGSKRELYLEALKRYCVRSRQTDITPLLENGPLRPRLERVFRSVIDSELGATEAQGCFLTNATLECAPSDEAVSELVFQSFKNGEEVFVRALSEAQARGELKPEHDAKALAHHLMNALNGLRITAKASPERTTLENVAALALRVLE